MSLAFPKPNTIRFKGPGYTAFRHTIFEHYHGICQDCGKYVPLVDGHVAHIKSRGAGGEDTIKNTLWKCPVCHGREHTEGKR